ncbi:MAG: hypothetical protein AABX33_02250 [Nanoarchaeota archaeon]
MIKISSKSQSWSMDVTLGVILFIAAFFIFYAMLNSNSNTKSSDLQEYASAVEKEFASDESFLRVVDNKEVNTSRVVGLKNLTYEELRRRLRIESDFCIYFEDENGQIVLINDSFTAIGTENIMIGGAPCSQK